LLSIDDSFAEVEDNDEETMSPQMEEDNEERNDLATTIATASVGRRRPLLPFLAQAAPTAAPTSVPTPAPTEQPTEEPTDEPTEKPTNEPTEEPESAPAQELQPFKMLGKGQACATGRITTEDDCTAAAAAVDLPWSMSWNGPTNAPGCVKIGRKVYFNKALKATGSLANNIEICGLEKAVECVSATTMMRDPINMTAQGWKFHDLESQNALDGKGACSESSWHAYAEDDNAGTAEFEFSFAATILLVYGNCWNSGKTNVYLNEKKIDSAAPKVASKEVTFDVKKNDKLELKDEDGKSVMQIVSMEVICPGEARAKCVSGTTTTRYPETMTGQGWKFHDLGPQNALGGKGECSNMSWHAHGIGNNAGTAEFDFNFSGSILLVYGNCWKSGKTNVYLNGKKIDSAPPNTTAKEVAFGVKKNDKLELKDQEGNAVMQIVSMEVICPGEAGKCVGGKTTMKDPSAMTAAGWKLWDFKSQNTLGGTDVCSESSWHAFGEGDNAGTAEFDFSFAASILLVYGNCGKSGKTNVYLNGEKIDSAAPNIASKG
jgi:hypothetical protein